MAPAIKRYVEKNDTISNRLVGMTSAQVTPDRILLQDLRKLNERVSKYGVGVDPISWIFGCPLSGDVLNNRQDCFGLECGQMQSFANDR